MKALDLQQILDALARVKAGYDATSCLAYEAIMQEGRNAKFTSAEMHHCQGNFPALNVGVTMGLDATYPTNLNSEGPHAKTLDCLLENEHIQRMAHFADGAFDLLAPNLYKHYHDHLKPLSKSVFTAAAFNFGGNVSTKVHRDCMNYAVGWYANQALGLFDPKNSGHIVLTDLKLIIEFPPGALILIPSATLAHGNLPVAQGESWVSFTQYCAGRLFCYVVNEFCTKTELQKRDPEKYANIMNLKTTQWEDNLKLHSIFKESALSIDNSM
ncbi:hypothetical protein C0992_004901 [Termitomyces sp. T32_za158]|nr:hypothetical protein C0992_004901 [Termitomyces sp. T32_za158]